MATQCPRACHHIDCEPGFDVSPQRGRWGRPRGRGRGLSWGSPETAGLSALLTSARCEQVSLRTRGMASLLTDSLRGQRPALSLSGTVPAPCLLHPRGRKGSLFPEPLSGRWGERRRGVQFGVLQSRRRARRRTATGLLGVRRRRGGGGPVPVPAGRVAGGLLQGQCALSGRTAAEELPPGQGDGARKGQGSSQPRPGQPSPRNWLLSWGKWLQVSICWLVKPENTSAVCIDREGLRRCVGGLPMISTICSL